MFKLERISEVNGNFIPQIRDSIFGNWYSKEKDRGFNWYREKYQIEYCSYDTLEKAREVLKTFKPITIRKIHKA